MGTWGGGCMDRWMHASLALDQLDRMFSRSAFKRLQITSWCLVNLNVLSPKTEARKMGHNKLNDDFLENGSN
jgi:hypothetical protein